MVSLSRYPAPSHSSSNVWMADGSTFNGMTTTREMNQARITAAAAEAVRKAGTPSEAALTRVAKVLATLSEDC